MLLRVTRLRAKAVKRWKRAGDLKKFECLIAILLCFNRRTHGIEFIIRLFDQRPGFLATNMYTRDTALSWQSPKTAALPHRHNATHRMIWCTTYDVRHRTPMSTHRNIGASPTDQIPDHPAGFIRIRHSLPEFDMTSITSTHSRHLKHDDCFSAKAGSFGALMTCLNKSHAVVCMYNCGSRMRGYLHAPTVP